MFYKEKVGVYCKLMDDINKTKEYTNRFEGLSIEYDNDLYMIRKEIGGVND